MGMMGKNAFSQRESNIQIATGPLDTQKYKLQQTTHSVANLEKERLKVHNWILTEGVMVHDVWEPGESEHMLKIS